MEHTDDIKAILQQVDPWPEEDRVALAYQILRDMRKHPKLPPRLKAKEARGLAAAATPAPDDVTVENWLDEYRMRKYG